MKAMIFGAVPDSELPGFRIRFSDGFEDVFYLAGEDYDLGPIGLKDGWLSYSPSVLWDLRVVNDLQDNQFVQHFSHDIAGIPTNVWVAEEMPVQSGGNFYVYYNGYSRFRMGRDENCKGVVYKNYSGDKVLNQQLAERAGKIIPISA